MEFKSVIYTKNEGIAIIKFNRPQSLNSLDRAAWQEFQAAITDAETDNDVRVIILTGEGKAFSSGDDIAEFGEIAKTVDGIQDFARMVLKNQVRMEKLSKPVISAVNGLCMGGGFELALATDIIIACEKAKFGLPEAMICAIAAFGTDRLPKIVGSKKAAELLLGCDPIDANEAYRLGIVNKVVPLEDLEAEAIAMAKKICRISPLAAKANKKAINQTRGVFDFEEFVNIATGLLTSEDFKEGFDAFLNKRAPVFKGN